VIIINHGLVEWISKEEKSLWHVGMWVCGGMWACGYHKQQERRHRSQRSPKQHCRATHSAIMNFEPRPECLFWSTIDDRPHPMAMLRNQRGNDKNEHHKGSLQESKTKNEKVNPICQK
jgi:hypothetical protein